MTVTCIELYSTHAHERFLPHEKIIQCNAFYGHAVFIAREMPHVRACHYSVTCSTHLQRHRLLIQILLRYSLFVTTAGNLMLQEFPQKKLTLAYADTQRGIAFSEWAINLSHHKPWASPRTTVSQDVQT